MKTSFTGILCLLTLLVSPVHAASTNAPAVTHVSLELRDGSRVVGVFTGKTLAFDSASLGDLKMAVERIRQIKWPSDQPIAELQATNGDKLNVSLRLTDLPITSSFGEIKVPVANIRQLQFSIDNGQTVRLPGLVALWSGEGDARDSVSGQTATVVGNVTYAPGKVGQAFSFDGSDSYVNIPSSDNINFSGNMPMTIETWVYRTGHESTEHIVGKRNDCDSGELQYQLAFDPTSGLSFIANGANFWVSSHRELPANTWQHLAVTYDGATAIIYINGEKVGSGGGSLGTAVPAPLKIGGSGSCQGFVGLIDEASLYNRALTADEIHQLFDAGNH